MNKFHQLKQWKDKVPTQGSDNLKKSTIVKKIPPEQKNLTIDTNIVKRTKPINTKITPEVYQILKKVAYQKGCKLVEIVEEGIKLVDEKLEKQKNK